MGKMTKELLTRAIQFVDFQLKAIKSSDSQFKNTCNQLNVIAQAYTDTCGSYNKARIKYLQLIDKYENANSLSVAPVKSFPGIYSKPSMTNDQMVEDSEEMKNLANLIREQAQKVTVIESELRSLAKSIYMQTERLVAANNNLSNYLDEMITGIDSAYDIGLFNAPND